MTVNQIIMYLLAFGAALGGIDHILGNKFGFGEKFESGFRMLGQIALSIAGIICLTPLLSSALSTLTRPVWNLLHIDPGIFGCILPIDMGGYQLSVDLAKDSMFGLLVGAIISPIFGCSIVYNIPVGVGFISDEDRPYFTKGILLGLTAIPLAILIGMLMLRLPLGYVLWSCLPILLICLFLIIGMIKKPDAMVTGFKVFSRIIKIIAILGLILGVITHLTGIVIVKNLLPLRDAMQTVSSICIVMLGSLPTAELIQRLMKVPFAIISKKTGLNGATTTAMLLGLVTSTPSLAMIPQMNRRGQVVAPACLVSWFCTFGAHFAYVNSMNPDIVPAMLTAKMLGGLFAGILAMITTRDLK